MRFHLLSLPHAQTTKAYSLDGFSQATIRFARLLKELGHTVLLYGGEENEALCDEFIPCITKEEVNTLLDFAKVEYQLAWIDEGSPIWQLANPRMIREIKKREQKGDMILSIGGISQQSIAQAFPHLAFIEYSVGYKGSFAEYRIYQSMAWRHYMYGKSNYELGRVFDHVIPLPFAPEEFTLGLKKEPFLLFVGRIIENKGVATAVHIAKDAKMPLKIIGTGKKDDIKALIKGTHVEYLGGLPCDQRNAWLARATAVLCPTIYVEPFNCVAIEAQLSGTPVVSVDYGGFTETIIPGVTGFRGTYHGEMIKAVKDCALLDPAMIRQSAIDRFSIDSLKPAFTRYFDRVVLMREDGPLSLRLSPAEPKPPEKKPTIPELKQMARKAKRDKADALRIEKAIAN